MHILPLSSRSLYNLAGWAQIVFPIPLIIFVVATVNYKISSLSFFAELFVVSAFVLTLLVSYAFVRLGIEYANPLLKYLAIISIPFAVLPVFTELFSANAAILGTFLYGFYLFSLAISGILRIVFGASLFSLDKYFGKLAKYLGRTNIFLGIGYVVLPLVYKTHTLVEVLCVLVMIMFAILLFIQTPMLLFRASKMAPQA